MRKDTAEVVAQVNRVVRTHWPTLTRNDRLTAIEALVGGKITGKELRIMYNNELIILHVDGDLGVYYTHEDDEREPLHISLLIKRTVIVTKTYEVEVPCFDTTQTDTLLHLAREYDEKWVSTNMTEKTND